LVVEESGLRRIAIAFWTEKEQNNC
jgi:hypothetical protein